MIRRLMCRFVHGNRATPSLFDRQVCEIRLSGLVAPHDLERTTSSVPIIDSDSRIDILFATLVEQNFINEWHAKNLRRHKYKGYFLDSYRIQGHLRTTDTRSYFAAVDTVTEENVEIEVVPSRFTYPKPRVHSVVGPLKDE